MNNIEYIKKLYYILEEIREKHPHINIKYTDKKINSFIKKCLNKYKLENKYDFYYVTNLIIILIRIKTIIWKL